MQCNDQHKYFSLFVLSVNKILRKAALAILTNLSRRMADKHEEHISQVRGWFNGRIKITIARLLSSMIRRDSLPSNLWEQEMDSDLGSGLGFVQ